MNSLFYFDIDDELFAEIKNNFNSGINSILDKMSQKNVSDGELTLKVNISLESTTVTDVNGNLKEILVPTIDHKASTKMTVKSETKGKINGCTDREFLAVTKIKGRYALISMPEDATQLSLEDIRRYAGLDEDTDDA